MTVGEALAWSLLSDDTLRTELSPCGENELGCLETQLHALAVRGFGREVRADELRPFVDAYAEVRREGLAHRGGLATMLGGFLVSPSLHYRAASATHVPGEDVPAIELAARLARALWQGLPDAELLAAARDGSLADPEEYRRQVDRMLADPRVLRTVDLFHQSWLRLEKLDAYDDGSAEYRAMREESVRFWRHIWEEGLGYEELLSADYTFVDEMGASLYGIELSGGGVQRVSLDPELRAGLLTQPAVMAASTSAHPEVHRGLLLIQDVLCTLENLPPPELTEVELMANANDRAANEECATCHRVIDPIGLSFNVFDDLGRMPDPDASSEGNVVDPLAEEIRGEFGTAAELARRIAASDVGRDCYVKQVVPFREPTARDRGRRLLPRAREPRVRVGRRRSLDRTASRRSRTGIRKGRALTEARPRRTTT